jgi:hypothetical protein
MKHDEPPHYMKADRDCMDRPTEGYWRQFLICSDGRCVSASAPTAEMATQYANTQRQEHEDFLLQDPRQRVKKIYDKYKANEYPNSTEQGDILRAFAQILGCI